MTRWSLLFVHSPLVGPSSLSRLAQAAASAGYETSTPDLTPMAASDHPHMLYRQLALDAGRTLTSPVVVGHSGAGAFLPGIGVAIGGAAALVFVDAAVPPVREPHRTPSRMVELLDHQSVDGVLRRWLEWWPEDVVAELLPDPADRETLALDMPNLPRSFYDLDIDVPDAWSQGPCGYLLLSSAYQAELEEAKARGWPTASLDSTHLGTFTDPELVLQELLQLVERITGGG